MASIDALNEPVYNIEVEGEHCYRVGQRGLLVHPMSGANPGIRPDPKSTGDYYLAYDYLDSDFFITGMVDSWSDCLRFAIVNRIRSTGKRSLIPPEDFFDAMMAWFSVPIACIRGIWNDTDPEKTTNLNIFNTLLACGKTDVEAAKGTFTGRMALNYHYSNVTFGPFAPPNGPPPYKQVHVYFRK